jgi:hypothetical protein
MRTISVIAHKRPGYLAQVLEALTLCAGIERYRVHVFCDRNPRRHQCAEVASRFGFTPVVHRRRLGCDRNTAHAIDHAFSDLGASYHLHLEDDTVPARGALLWFEWAERFATDPSVLTVSGYHREPSGTESEYERRPWLTPWGFATWADRWERVRWSAPKARGWDIALNSVREQEGLVEVHPCVSRIQNIGAEDALHVPSPAWHAEHHHAREVADELVTDFSLKTGSDRCGAAPT